MTILPNIHTTPETAFVCADYPYGFRLRCKIRYWLETNKKGTRFCSQTTNPRSLDGEQWNKAKASTYIELSGAMYLDENGHVQWRGVGQYTDLPKLKEFAETFGQNATNFSELNKYIRHKEIFEEELAKFTPRPEYGTALFRHAYLATRHRMESVK